MPYTINKTNGGFVTTIPDGNIDTTTDLTLFGKNYTGYGEILNENLVKLMENFANATAPVSPMPGQLWWDLNSKTLKVNTSPGMWKTISGATAANSEPTNKTLGDLWFNSETMQLYVYNGTTWTLIGPSYSAGTGVSGAVVDSIFDDVGVPHIVIKYLINGSTIVAMMSKDTAFKPATSISGFEWIYPGITVSSNNGSGFFGTASNADKLDGINSTQFMRSDANTSTTGTLSVANDTGIIVGESSDLRLSVDGSDTYITNNTSNGDIYIRVNKAGTVSNAVHIDGATGWVYGITPPAGDNSAKYATTQYVDSIAAGTSFLRKDGTTALTGNLLPDATNTRSLGDSSYRYSDVWATNFIGKATTAQYADLAERFETDKPYEPGTVVELGGDKEITAVEDDLSEKVFGVISTEPGFLLNGGAGPNATHPAVALNGRVPVKVIGKVNRGDRLVSAGNGLARAAKVGEANSFNVIGRALESKSTTGISTIIAIVKVQ